MTGREGQSDTFNVFSVIGTYNVDIEHTSLDLETVLLSLDHLPNAIPVIMSTAMKLKPHCVKYECRSKHRAKITRTSMPSDDVCSGCKVLTKSCPMRLVWENDANRNLIDSSIRNIVIVD